MLTVPEAAKRTGRNPETIRRWIREGKLRASKIGTQHVIEEQDLDRLLADEVLPLPRWWPHRTRSGAPLPDSVAIIRGQRRAH